MLDYCGNGGPLLLSAECFCVDFCYVYNLISHLISRLQTENSLNA